MNVSLADGSVDILSVQSYPYSLVSCRGCRAGYLEVGLSVERGGEGHVVERAGRRPARAVRRHARHAVLRLIGRQLAAQLVRCDVRLQYRPIIIIQY